MQRRTFASSIGVAALAFGLAACSGDSSTGPGLTVPDAEITAGVATDAGDAVATSVDQMNAEEASYGASGSLVAAPAVSASVSASTASTASTTCGDPAADGWITCSTTTWRGLALTRQIRFWEGTSYGLWWDSTRTDSVNHRATLTGSFDPALDPAKTVWVDRADTASMVVDRSATLVRHIWTRVGTRADSARYTTANVTRDFHYTAFDTATAVTFAMPRSQYPWPQSGTVVHDITTHFTATRGTGTYSRTVTHRVVVTFDGTQTATLQIGALTCSLDLATHDVSGCH